LSLLDARGKIENWRRVYNKFRPHSSLENLTPYEVHEGSKIGLETLLLALSKKQERSIGSESNFLTGT